MPKYFIGAIYDAADPANTSTVEMVNTIQNSLIIYNENFGDYKNKEEKNPGSANGALRHYRSDTSSPNPNKGNNIVLGIPTGDLLGYTDNTERMTLMNESLLAIENAIKYKKIQNVYWSVGDGETDKSGRLKSNKKLGYQTFLPLDWILDHINNGIQGIIKRNGFTQILLSKTMPQDLYELVAKHSQIETVYFVDPDIIGEKKFGDVDTKNKYGIYTPTPAQQALLTPGTYKKYVKSGTIFIEE